MKDTQALFEALNQQFGTRARLNEPLAHHTTLRLGGPADIWFPARSVDELVLATALARQQVIPVFILGGGANLLIRDDGIRGLVIENRANAVQFQGTQILAQSGAINPRLAKQCAQRGLGGFEWAVGVPGTLGGAVVNNAGAYGHSIAQNLVQVELLDSQGERVWRKVDWFDYQYRSSKIKQYKADKPLVLQAILDFIPKPQAMIESQMMTYNTRRKATQPPGATVGSMFKNPSDDYAGRLIEASGLKGYRIEQAEISSVHANFFVNLGGAKSDHVLRLINVAQERVYQLFGIQLALEIEII